MSDRAVYVISVAAELAGVHPQTLRVYERKGLLNPERTSGNTRRYSATDIERLRRIQDLTQGEGINLAGVKLVLDLETQMERMRDQLTRMADRLEKAEAEMADRMRDMAREAGAILPASVPLDLEAMLRELERRSRKPIPLGPASEA